MAPAEAERCGALIQYIPQRKNSYLPHLVPLYLIETMGRAC